MLGFGGVWLYLRSAFVEIERHVDAAEVAEADVAAGSVGARAGAVASRYRTVKESIHCKGARTAWFVVFRAWH